MSFTTRVKNEISNEYSNKNANMAELAAILRNCYHQDTGLELITENSTICKHIYNLFKETYNINVKTEIRTTRTKNRLYGIAINDKLDVILKDLGVLDENNKYQLTIPDYMVESEDEKRAYLKGVFLVTGSINDPKTSMYHLEFKIDYLEEAKYISLLLNEFYLNSKVINRDKGYMVYIKEAEKIGDFLRIIGASLAVMYFEDIRIYRDHKNMTNRLNNCEQANFEKSMLTSTKQVNDIKLIEEAIGLDAMDVKIEEAARYRLKYPESSLEELSGIMSLETNHAITKSGLNHRFRKIKEIAERIRENQNKS